MTDLTTAEEAQSLANNLAYSVLDVETGEELDPGVYAQLSVEDAKRARVAVLACIALHAQLADAQAAQALVVERDAAREALMNAGVALHVSKREVAETKAERDRLAAANAVLEAKVAGLVEAVKPFDAVGGTLFSKNWNMSDIVFDGGPMRSDCLFFEDFLNLRAALATQEAGT